MLNPRSAVVLLSFLLPAWSQTTSSLRVRVMAPDGKAIQDASVRLVNRAAGFERQLLWNETEAFSLENIPPQSYRLTVDAAGFAGQVEEVDLRTGVPVTRDIILRLASVNETITVHAETADLVDVEATGTRTALASSAMEKIPTLPGSRGIEGYLLTFPGFAMNANGAIHPRGAHNQMTFVIDGMPINDQMTGAFATALDPNVVDSLQLYTGDIPAEFGAKVSGVAAVSTRSAAGSGRRLFGQAQVGGGGFDALQTLTQAGGERGRLAWFGSVSAVKTHRFLDQVSFDNLHNGGNSERGYLRLDYQAGSRDVLHLHAMAGRSGFELANLRSQQAAGMDQRQLLRDVSVWLRWNRVIGPTATWESTVAYRPTVAQLFPSAHDTPVTAAQARHLTTVTATNRLNKIAGSHSIRSGVDVQHFAVSENFSMGLTRPGSNASLLPYDLSQGGRLFLFSDRGNGSLYSVFAQDSVKWRRLVLGLGARYDNYRFLVRGNQLQPRVGLALNLKETGTVFRLSYNRNFQTPPNENLLLSSSAEAAKLAPESVRRALGGTPVPLRSQRENVFEAGIQQSIFGRAGLNASVYHKDSRDQQDNNNFLDTGIIFPVTLARIRVNGVEGRLTLPRIGGLTSTFSATHSHAVSSPPFTGGLFLGQDAVDLLTSGPFVIDHDQKLSCQSSTNYTFSRNWWVGTTVRYDSGLVANPSSPAKVAADPDFRDLLPYVDLLSKPARVRPHTVTDIVVAYENWKGDRRRWDAQVQIANLFQAAALYNFQSVFVGTRLVAPRSAGLKLRWFW